jgi:Protein of unknown function (DUF2794)
MTPTADRLFRLADYQTKRKIAYFNRPELDKLLQLYSRHVARGEWRDYAIDHVAGRAMFSVFRHTHETPLYAIVKYAGGQRPAEYVVLSGRERLAAGRNLDDVLSLFQKRLTLVHSRG